MLLGTEFLTKFVKTSQKGEVTSLLSNLEYNSTTQSERKDLLTPSSIGVLSESKIIVPSYPVLEVDNHYVTVKLLQAVKIPAPHSTLVHFQAKNSEPVLFEEKIRIA